MEGIVIEMIGGKEVVDKLSKLERVELGRLLSAAVEDISDFSASAAKRLAPIRTGALKMAIAKTNAHRGIVGYEASAGIVRGAHHAIYVDQGTGIYGYRHSLIRPMTANYLVWVSPSHGRWRAKTTKGQKGQHFMLRAFELTQQAYVPLRLERLKAEIRLLL